MPPSSGSLDPADFEDFFTRRLDSYYAENRNEYRLDQTESAKLRARLREANALFIKSRRTDTSLEEREKALQKLETGYLKFLEIAQNLDEGRKFYNELAKMLGRWREEIRGFVYQRKKEARDLEGYLLLGWNRVNGRDVAGEMARMKISDGTREKSPVQQERRTSQRITRSAKKENKPEDINTDGKPTGPGMWTPGFFPPCLNFATNECFRPRNSIWLKYPPNPHFYSNIHDTTFHFLNSQRQYTKLLCRKASKSISNLILKRRRSVMSCIPSILFCVVEFRYFATFDL